VFKINLLLVLIIFIQPVLAQNYDPTRPLSTSKQASGVVAKKGLVLESIIQGKKNKSAIISGKLMKIGDYIGNHKLVSVSRSSVILRSEEERLKLSVFSGVVVK